MIVQFSNGFSVYNSAKRKGLSGFGSFFTIALTLPVLSMVEWSGWP
ncbi:hypothetical protein BIFBRE_03055 [Bifidobacterium breve DSM 20213 = JCM 1192]|uniref:Uncharacterized protein n=1 Tax=Bifidobacterium breve DSM 20213 = JCM 1192 TaxID=518634 RepID=D4BLW8_BIFBR|nr:hypothetical protein BIFBRE_03055 [Bifidobacterium breve DSM 20213 = JCM 1192]